MGNTPGVTSYKVVPISYLYLVHPRQGSNDMSPSDREEPAISVSAVHPACQTNINIKYKCSARHPCPASRKDEGRLIDIWYRPHRWECCWFPRQTDTCGGKRNPGGGGHCLFEGSYPLSNYHPRFFWAVCPWVFFDRPLFLRVAEHRLLKSYFLNSK